MARITRSRTVRLEQTPPSDPHVRADEHVSVITDHKRMTAAVIKDFVATLELAGTPASAPVSADLDGAGHLMQLSASFVNRLEPGTNLWPDVPEPQPLS